MTKALLFIGDRHCRAAVWKRGFLHSEAEFPNSEEGRRQYEHYLDGMKPPPVSILVDLVEEDYRIENIPALGWRDRKHLHARKLDQYYRYTPFRNASFQGRAGKNDRVLFSALTSPNLVLPWIESLSGRRVAVSGIASVAMLSGRFVEKIPSSHLLLLSFQSGTGLRQSFFLDGHLNFSRLTLIHPGEDTATVVQLESERIYKYLHTLNLFPESGALMVCILCGFEDRKSFDNILADTASVHHVFFDMKEAATRIGFRGNAEGSDSLPLFLHLLGLERVANQYGSEAHTHIYDLRQWQHSGFVLSALLILVGAVFAGVDFSRAISLHAQSRIQAARAESIMIEYRKFIPSDPRADSPQKMKAAVMLYERVSSLFPRPKRFLSEVSQALDAYPDVNINRLAWQAAKNPESVNAVTGEIRLGQDAFESAPLYEAISIEGEIFPFDGDYRRANETVDRFCAELEKKGMRVTKIKLPLDLDPDSSFTGKAVEDRAAFSLKAFWKGGA
ncbi:MAG: hypothetical protein K2P57_06960 [Burkholderiales bacterium]|nr:hypothetical protein [Burkholderiales bacterium]